VEPHPSFRILAACAVASVVTSFNARPSLARRVIAASPVATAINPKEKSVRDRTTSMRVKPQRVIDRFGMGNDIGLGIGGRYPFAAFRFELPQRKKRGSRSLKLFSRDGFR